MDLKNLAIRISATPMGVGEGEIADPSNPSDPANPDNPTEKRPDEDQEDINPEDRRKRKKEVKDQEKKDKLERAVKPKKQKLKQVLGPGFTLKHVDAVIDLLTEVMKSYPGARKKLTDLLR